MTRFGALLTTAMIVVALPATAAPADPQDVANDISNHVMSPFCPGVTLHDCPSREAAELRDEIARWAAAGLTKDRITARLEHEFGAGIRATPSTEGAGIIAWVLPALAVMSGAAVAVVLARRWNARQPTAPSVTAAPVSQQDRTRLDGELRRMRQDQA
jgi:cytochrome c-type biogenesis protein CcmH/NrfF